MKKNILLFFMITFCALILSSCVKDERDEAKQIVQKFLNAVHNDDVKTASLLMPFIDTLDQPQKDALLGFIKGIASETYVLSVPDKKGSVYDVSISVQGPEKSTVHYSFEVKKEDDNTWIILDKVTQKITYDSFTL